MGICRGLNSQASKEVNKVDGGGMASNGSGQGAAAAAAAPHADNIGLDADEVENNRLMLPLKSLVLVQCPARARMGAVREKEFKNFVRRFIFFAECSTSCWLVGAPITRITLTRLQPCRALGVFGPDVLH